MRDEVNLLTIKQEKNRKIPLFFSISLLILLVSVILVVASLMYVLFLKVTLPALLTSKKNTLSEMSKFNRQRIELLTVSERLLSIKKIIASKQNFSQRVGIIVQNMPEGLTMDSITVQGSKVSMKIYSSSLATFNTFFSDSLLKLPQQKKSSIKKIDILGFSIEQNGGYSALIDITYDAALVE